MFQARQAEASPVEDFAPMCYGYNQAGFIALVEAFEQGVQLFDDVFRIFCHYQ
jgi:hypothetical protein